ncbi:hypothetical protein MBLNU13_g08545t1 [Cladosporium sp. NU13]
MSGNNPSATAEPALPPKKPTPNLRYVSYGTEKESPFLPAIRQLISNDLSEPYSIYVYRYFLYQWGHLCFMALDDDDNLIGVIVCKLEPHRGGPMRGYIAMLATRKDYRGHGIATSLVKMAIEKMISQDADEIALETEVDNIPSLRIYENLGFIRTKRLHRYYLNGNTAFRLVLYLKPGIPWRPTYPPDYPMPVSDPAAMQGRGLVGEDLFARQATQMQIEDVHGEQFDIMKAAKNDDF